jgi:ribosomal protein L40E
LCVAKRAFPFHISAIVLKTNCPHCGAELPKRAKSCRECGSDEQTGWSEAANIGALNLPDEEFNYDEFVKREFGSGKNLKPRGLSWIWWVVAVLLSGCFILWNLRSFFNF